MLLCRGSNVRHTTNVNATGDSCVERVELLNGAADIPLGQTKIY